MARKFFITKSEENTEFAINTKIYIYIIYMYVYMYISEIFEGLKQLSL